MSVFIYLFLAVLGLRRCRLFSSCSEQGILSRASHCGGFSCCRARALEYGLQQLRLPGPRAQAQYLRHRRDLVGPRHVRSSRIRD